MSDQAQLSYLRGFGNEFESEAPGFKGALPKIINPKQLRYKLVAEQLSGTAFTAPRERNKRSWLYRRWPSVCHEPFSRVKQPPFKFGDGITAPNQTRWFPFKRTRTSKKNNFVEGLRLLAFSDPSGSASSSVAIYIYIAEQSMPTTCFLNADGDFLLVPQEGSLTIRTEFGRMQVEPDEIAVIQQGMKFSIDIDQDFVRGYMLEVRGNHFELPQLGPIGANCLANPRDFRAPTAHVEDDCPGGFDVILKFQNELFETIQSHTPYDVVAWFGNYTPYKYNLKDFVSVNSVSVDHPDPSIFTVLTCPSIGKPGTALADFVIFPPRWECAQDTFRLPYFHRNCMTEFMGLIKGSYQGKSEKFAPGGASLHQSMIPHGPDLDSFNSATCQDTSKPKRVADDTMAFMFETASPLKLTEWALDQGKDETYHDCWRGLSDLSLRSFLI